jgi:hypothetical protein
MGNWEISSGLYTASIWPLYGLYTAFIRTYLLYLKRWRPSSSLATDCAANFSSSWPLNCSCHLDSACFPSLSAHPALLSQPSPLSRPSSRPSQPLEQDAPSYDRLSLQGRSRTRQWRILSIGRTGSCGGTTTDIPTLEDCR